MKFSTYIHWILCLLMVVGCKEQSSENKTEEAIKPTSSSNRVSLTDAQLKNASIEVGTPSLKNLSPVLSLQGKIDVPPQSTISLSFPLGGYLKSTQMLPGTHVRKGQILAELEDMQFIQIQQDYLTAKAKYTLAETEYHRQKDLNASKASSDKVLQYAQAEMETQKINMHALGRKLEVIGINPKLLSAENIHKSVPVLSPINGFVSKVNVNVGKYTAPTDMLFELVDPRDIHLALDVFEKDLSKLSIGQKVIAYNNSEPDKKYVAKIILISKSLNQDRTAEVHCHFDKYNPMLVPGMFMNAEVSLKNVQTLTVTEDALVRWENKFYVFKDHGSNNFEMIEVEPGTSHQGFQEITSNQINPNTRLVTKNAYSLLMKIKNTAED